MANPSRGEVEIILGGKSYTMAATLNQACELEDAANMGLYGMADKMSTPAGIRLSLVSVIIYCGIRGGYDRSGKDMNEAPTLEEIKTNVFEAGVINVAAFAMALLEMWLTGGEEEDISPKKKVRKGKAV